MKRPQDTMRPVSDERYDIVGLDVPNLSDLRLWVFDLEATGLDTTRERVTQVAGIPIEGGRILEEEAFAHYVFPGANVEMAQEVQDLTGITPETVEGAPPFPNVWDQFVEAAKDCDVWVGQSVFEFDVPLLESEFARHGISQTLPPVLDSVVLATALLGAPQNRWSTSALISEFNVNTAGLRRHDALDDVKILSRILIPMLERYREKRFDRLYVPASEPLAIRRHAPVRTEPSKS